MNDMVRKITVERRKKFAGAAIKYFVVLNLKGSEFNQNIGMKEKLSLGSKSSFLSESKQVFPLSNGETITIDTLEEKNSFFIVAFTSAGRLFSQRIFVDDQDFNARYVVTLKMGVLKNEFIIEKV